MKKLIRFTVDLADAFGSAMRYNQWMMNEKMWLLASLEELSANPLNANSRKILLYYRQVAEQHYLKKFHDLIDEQILVMVNEEEA